MSFFRRTDKSEEMEVDEKNVDEMEVDEESFKPDRHLNTTKNKRLIIIDFIKKFIYSNIDVILRRDSTLANNIIDNIIAVCIQCEIFFGGEYINSIIMKREHDIDIYIDYRSIELFLIRICEIQTYFAHSVAIYGENQLLINLEVSLNLNSSYNDKLSKIDSVFELIYVNKLNNNRINIYIVNDEHIIEKIVYEKTQDNHIWYDLKRDMICRNDISSLSFELLQQSHVIMTKKEKKLYDNEFKDVILEIIKYIPEYIKNTDYIDKFNILANIEQKYKIYYYPAIWMYYLIKLEDVYKYTKLQSIFNELVNLNVKKELKQIIRKIYTNNLLSKYNINLTYNNEEKTVQFLTNCDVKQDGTRYIEETTKEYIRLLLLFYFTHKIYEAPYSYQFQSYIKDMQFFNVIKTLPVYVITEDNLSTRVRNESVHIKTTSDIIEYYKNKGKTFYNAMETGDIEDPCEYIKDPNNVFIVEDGSPTIVGFSKNDLEKALKMDEKWLIDCANLSNYAKRRYREGIDYHNDLYIQIFTMTGNHYISYSDIYTLLNSSDKIYILFKARNINKSITKAEFHRYARSGDTIEGHLNYLNQYEAYPDRFPTVRLGNNCQESIKSVVILKRIKIDLVEENFDITSKIRPESINITDILNKKLNVSTHSQDLGSSARTSRSSTSSRSVRRI